MDKIVEKVVEIEYKAQKIIEEVEHERNLLSVHIDDEIEKLRKDIFSLVKSKLKSTREEKLQYANKESGKIIAEAEQKAATMEKDFMENRKNWVQCLLDQAIGR